MTDVVVPEQVSDPSLQVQFDVALSRVALSTTIVNGLTVVVPPNSW
jgi:hypothetical protein